MALGCARGYPRAKDIPLTKEEGQKEVRVQQIGGRAEKGEEFQKERSKGESVPEVVVLDGDDEENPFANERTQQQGRGNVSAVVRELPLVRLVSRAKKEKRREEKQERNEETEQGEPAEKEMEEEDRDEESWGNWNKFQLKAAAPEESEGVEPKDIQGLTERLSGIRGGEPTTSLSTRVVKIARVKLRFRERWAKESQQRRRRGSPRLAKVRGVRRLKGETRVKVRRGLARIIREKITRRTKSADRGMRRGRTQEVVMSQQVHATSTSLAGIDTEHSKGGPAIGAKAVTDGRALSGTIRERDTPEHIKIGAVPHKVTTQKIRITHSHEGITGFITATSEVHHPHLLYPGVTSLSKPTGNKEAGAAISAVTRIVAQEGKVPRSRRKGAKTKCGVKAGNCAPGLFSGATYHTNGRSRTNRDTRNRGRANIERCGYQRKLTGDLAIVPKWGIPRGNDFKPARTRTTREKYTTLGGGRKRQLARVHTTSRGTAKCGGPYICTNRQAKTKAGQRSSGWRYGKLALCSAVSGMTLRSRRRRAGRSQNPKGLGSSCVQAPTRQEGKPAKAIPKSELTVHGERGRPRNRLPRRNRLMRNRLKLTKVVRISAKGRVQSGRFGGRHPRKTKVNTKRGPKRDKGPTKHAIGQKGEEKSKVRSTKIEIRAASGQWKLKSQARRRERKKISLQLRPRRSSQPKEIQCGKAGARRKSSSGEVAGEPSKANNKDERRELKRTHTHKESG